MGSRYYITGVQLGMLKVFIEQMNPKELIMLWDKIYAEQYLCEATDRCPFWLEKQEGKKK